MAPRNINSIGPSGNIKPIPSWIVVPPATDSDYYFEIITDTETIDLADLVNKASISYGVTDTVGTFELAIIDPQKTVYNKIDTFDELFLYADYGAPTTKRFRGKIERKGYQDIYTILSGRGNGMIFASKNIIYSPRDSNNNPITMAKSDVLKAILTEFFPNVTQINIEENTDLIVPNYFEIPMTTVITELCGATHAFFLDPDNDANYFLRGSRTNMVEAISETANHIETSDNAKDTENTYSKVRIYGSTINDIPIIQSSASDTSNTKGIEKEYKTDNASVLTDTQGAYLAQSEALERKEAPRVGQVSALFLPTLMPGEKLFVIIPREDITPDYYEVVNYTHSFDLSSEFDKITTINLKKSKVSTSSIIRDILKFNDSVASNPNPQNMDYSLIYDFSTDEGTFTNTQRNFITSGLGGYYVLKTISGADGSWTSPEYQLAGNLSKLEFRISGDFLEGTLPEGTKIQFSIDGGITFYTYLSTEEAILTGDTIIIKVNLSSADTAIKSVGALYSLDI